MTPKHNQLAVKSEHTYTILYGDDDPDMQTLVKLILQRAGMKVVLASNGQEVLDVWRKGHFDGVVLDVMMPIIDGLELCRRIRRISQVPLILLTARGQEDEVVRGLEAGADDYIVKPIRQKEFLARLTVALKRAERTQKQELQTLQVRDMVIVPKKRSVLVRGKPIGLSPLEYNLLLYLANRVDSVVTKQELYDNVWGFSLEKDAGFIDLNIVEAAIRRLRRKLGEDPANPQFIQTVRGIGYQLRKE